MQFGNFERVWALGDGITLGDGLTLNEYIGAYHTFIRRQASKSRYPTFSVLLEYFGDISPYVKSVNCNMMITDSLHQPTYGRGNIIIYDKAGIYTDGGRSLIDENFKVFIFAGFNDDNIPIWAGRVTDAKADTDKHEVNIALAQDGHILANRTTSGSFSAYNTAKTLTDYLCGLAGLAKPIYENESGQPTGVTFGNSFQENNRSYWAMVYGACLNIFYIPIFDVNGVLNLKRRDSFNDVDFLYNDSNIEYMKYLEEAEMINRKTIDYTNPVRFEFELGDGVQIGQRSKSAQNSYSIAQWNEKSDYETDPFIGTWTRAEAITDQVLDFYPYRRALYEVRSPGIPQLELLDRVRVRYEKQNIQGKFIVMGRRHEITPGNHVTTDKLLSSGERL